MQSVMHHKACGCEKTFLICNVQIIEGHRNEIWWQNRHGKQLLENYCQVNALTSDTFAIDL